MEWVLCALLAAVLILQLILLLRKPTGVQETRRELSELRTLVDEMRRSASEEARSNHWETGQSIHRLEQQLASLQKDTLQQQSDLRQAVLRQQNEQQEKLFRTLTEQSDRLNGTLSDTVGKLQQSNEKKLDQMRETVDEKLSSTLAQRLDTSFKTVGDQLQNVYQSLGDMKKLAGDVNDLQRVLTNVKARGTWAEVQLGNLLEQTLTSEQFARNVSVKNNREAVEYAIKIPSREKDGDFVWLPIDSKFPQEDYLRLSEAADRADKPAVDAAAKQLEQVIKKEAQTIANLYIQVPETTDFAILFLPTEGLYAEVLRRPGLAEELQQKYRVMVCGPTTLTAFLNTLRIGFRTIALDKRAADVWKVLGAVKDQYETFGALLSKAQKKVGEVGSALEDAQKRAGIIQKRLRTVESLSETAEANAVLGIPADLSLPEEDSPSEA